MPYKRTKKTTYRRRPAKSGYVRKVARTEARKAVMKTVETKIFDTSQTAQAIDYTSGYVTSVTNGMIRGTSEDDYIGDSIKPVGISIRAQFTRSDATQMFRFIIIQNKAGGIPLLSTLLQSVSNVTAPLSPLDKDFSHTYAVLVDRLISMDSLRGTTTVRNFKINSNKLRGLWYNDSLGSIQKGGIYICVISDSAAASHPVLDYRCRFYYKDA